MYHKKVIPGKLVFCDIEKPVQVDNEVSRMTELEFLFISGKKSNTTVNFTEIIKSN